MPHQRVPKIGYLVVAGGVLLCQSANADVIKCSFTEPFITTTFDTSRNRMTVTYDVEKRQTTFDRVSMRQTGPRTFELRNAKGEVLQRMQRSCRGSDGMSDRKYPYEAKLIAQKLYGGCTSSRSNKC